MILTGTVESEAKFFACSRRAMAPSAASRFTVRIGERIVLERQNFFQRVIPYHSAEHPKQAERINL